jgi:hypothetical protein
MDGMSDFSVLVDATRAPDGVRGDPRAKVHVRWDPHPPKIPAEAATYLEARWEAYLVEARASEKTLFNGPITRLVSASRCADGEIDLLLGPADYKTFLVVHLRDRPWFAAHAPMLSAAALGNSVLLTSGDRALLGIRSPRVSAYAGHAHLVGGVLDCLSPAQSQAPSAEHLVDHLLKELSEEAEVTADDLLPRDGDWPRFMGVVRDEFLAQPEAIWQWETRTPLEEFARRLSPQEHAGAVQVTRARADSLLWQRMTPVARHTWRLWSGN